MKLFNNKYTELITKKIMTKNRLKRYSLFILGVLFLAISFNLFLLPSKIVYGGVSGISIIVTNLFKIDPANFIFIVSMLLLICSFLLLGKNKTINSITGSILFPLFVKLTANIGDYIVLEENNDLLLISIFAGLLSGFGAGLTFKTGFTTGGTDIIHQITHKYMKISIGKSALMIDGAIVIANGIIFGWEIAMYGIMVLYINSIMTDKVILGISESKSFYIITSKEKEVKEFLLNNLNIRITILDAEGGYTGKNKKVLMCIIPTSEYFVIKEGLNTIDKDIFFVVMDSYEVSRKEVENETI